MKQKIKIGYMGLGRRGMGMLKACFAEMADVEITAVCDLIESKIDAACALLAEKGRPVPKRFTDYRKMLKEDLDAVVIMTGWHNRARYAMDAMEAGKYTAIEVGCAYDVSECYDLVETYERTGSPLMMLENCCYGRREMAALKMAREGLFGRIVQCQGGYLHDLRREDLLKKLPDGTYDMEHYRVSEYFARNTEQYPTHELGPIAKLLRLNRGNRLVSLRSFASAAWGLDAFIRDELPADHPCQQMKTVQSDIVTTIMDCANGEQIVLMLDTTLPRAFYSRGFTVRGTKGMCQESCGKVCTYYLDGQPETFNNEEEWLKEHDHPLHAEYLAQTRGGHGGMDWLVVRAFVESVKRGIEPPIDAYDTALWMVIAPLAEASIAQGGAAVAVPDFTRGKWFHQEQQPGWKYSLDEVCSEPETPIVPE